MSLVNITPNALQHFREILSENADLQGWGVRFGLEKKGCSGWMYALEFEEKPTDADEVVDVQGIRFFVPKEHMDKLQNATIDWAETLMEAGFKIDNPQAKRPCGCGQSIDFEAAPAGTAQPSAV